MYKVVRSGIFDPSCMRWKRKKERRKTKSVMQAIAVCHSKKKGVINGYAFSVL